MSIKYFVLPPDYTDWSLDHGEFVAALHQRWRVRKVCTTYDDPNIHFSLDWSLWVDDDRLLVGLMDREGKAVALEADLRDSAVFALWFRSIVPEEQELLFCDESYSGSIELTGETTEQQILDAIPDAAQNMSP